MNSIFPVWPVVEPVLDDQVAGAGPIEPGTSDLDEESMPEGVALLLAGFAPVSRIDWAGGRPRRGDGPPMVRLGQQADVVIGLATDAWDGQGRDSLAVVGVLEKGDLLSTAKGIGVAGDVLPGESGELLRGTPGASAGTIVDGGDAAAMASDEGDAPAGSALETPGQIELAWRAGDELAPPVVSARSESQSAQTLLEGLGSDRETTADLHEGPPESPDQDDEMTGDFLQVPFRNERAQGSVLISREGAGTGGLLIRATDRQVFEQLRGHLDQARQPHWRLAEATLPENGARSS